MSASSADQKKVERWKVKHSPEELECWFPINPQTLARYREAWAPSGAKDDPSDAKLGFEVSVTHRDKHKPPRPQKSGDASAAAPGGRPPTAKQRAPRA